MGPIVFLVVQIGALFAALIGKITLAEALLPSAFVCWVLIYFAVSNTIKLRSQIAAAIAEEAKKHPPGWKSKAGDFIPFGQQSAPVAKQPTVNEDK